MSLTKVNSAAAGYILNRHLLQLFEVHVVITFALAVPLMRLLLDSVSKNDLSWQVSRKFWQRLMFSKAWKRMHPMVKSKCRYLWASGPHAMAAGRRRSVCEWICGKQVQDMQANGMFHRRN